MLFRRRSGSDEFRTRLLGGVGGGRLVVVPALGVLVGSLLVSGGVVLRLATARASSASACQFQMATPPVNVALCETFDQPASPPSNSRSPALSDLWGVSRLLGTTNFGQNQYDQASVTQMDKCGTTVTVMPVDDVQICNGMLVEAVNDNHNVTSLAMYPKQPFDVAGRTGTVAFDVSDDSHGGHAAWPELWYTDTPQPVPFVHEDTLQSTPKSAVGIRLAQNCGVNSGGCGARAYCPQYPQSVPVVTIDSADVVTNYVSNDSVQGGSIVVTPVDCVKASSGPGDMNHFEVRFSQNEIDVYGADAGAPTSAVHKIGVISNFTLPLTRGLVWIEDAHYNGDKFGTGQQTHTFTWDNVGFDGPTLPRDLAFDVLDHNDNPGGPLTNLGWATSPGDPAPLSVTVSGVHDIANAVGAVLTFNYVVNNPVTVSYRVNNGAWHDQPWVFPCVCNPKTIAAPVPLADVQPGTNTIQFKSTDTTSISSVDLILQGAGGPPPTTTTTSSPSTTTTTVPSSTTTTVPASTTTTLPSRQIFGNSRIGPLRDSGDFNGVHGSQFTTAESSRTVVSMSVFVDSVQAAPNNQYQVAIYTVDANGNPAALVAASASATLKPLAWNTVAITATLAANTGYWLEYNTNGNNSLRFASAPAFGIWPASAIGSQSKMFSIYATLQ